MQWQLLSGRYILLLLQGMRNIPHTTYVLQFNKYTYVFEIQLNFGFIAMLSFVVSSDLSL